MIKTSKSTPVAKSTGSNSSSPNGSAAIISFTKAIQNIAKVQDSFDKSVLGLQELIG